MRAEEGRIVPILKALLRLAEPSDFERIWEIFHAVIQGQDTWYYDPATSKEQAREIWMDPKIRTFVATFDGRVEAMYFLRPNAPGLASHVCNAGYMVDPHTHSHGLGSQMCEHSILEAKRLGYRAMQYNFVVSTNQRAVELWKRMGFSIIGTSPQAFRHGEKGYVDAYVMHRFL